MLVFLSASDPCQRDIMGRGEGRYLAYFLDLQILVRYQMRDDRTVSGPVLESMEDPEWCTNPAEDLKSRLGTFVERKKIPDEVFETVRDFFREAPSPKMLEPVS